MNSDFSILRDPATKEPLRCQGDALVNAAGRCYPLVAGIPRFVASDNYSADFGAQWKRFPRTQLDSNTGLNVSTNRLERCFRGELEAIHDKKVLEVGSGAGRFTEILVARGANVFSLDYSNAVEANFDNNGTRQNLMLLQADIRQMPFDPASFDYVVCLGVIQHTPSPEESIDKLYEMVRPGGRLIFDHYRRRIRFMLPTPFGDAGTLYRWIALRLKPKVRAQFISRVTDFWFPFHWRYRNSVSLQRLLRRLSPVRFYYPELPLRDRQMHYEWSQLDTHDATTDYFKHLRSPEQILRRLRALGAIDIQVSVGGNGVEAFCVKPQS